MILDILTAIVAFLTTPVFATANLVEIVWTVAAVIGAGTALFEAYDSVIDKRVTDAYGINGRRFIIANSNLRNAICRVAMLLLFVAVGVLALEAPPPHVREITVIGT